HGTRVREGAQGARARLRQGAGHHGLRWVDPVRGALRAGSRRRARAPGRRRGSLHERPLRERVDGHQGLRRLGQERNPPLRPDGTVIFFTWWWPRPPSRAIYSLRGTVTLLPESRLGRGAPLGPTSAVRRDGFRGRGWTRPHVLSAGKEVVQCVMVNVR